MTPQDQPGSQAHLLKALEHIEAWIEELEHKEGYNGLDYMKTKKLEKLRDLLKEVL